MLSPVRAPSPGSLPAPVRAPSPGKMASPGRGPTLGRGRSRASRIRRTRPRVTVTRFPRSSTRTRGPASAPPYLLFNFFWRSGARTLSPDLMLALTEICPVMRHFTGLVPGARGRIGPGSGAEGRPDGRHDPRLVINCARSGKDRVKDFVIDFTSSPSTADERPVIPFLNLTGQPDRSSSSATGSCTARGVFARVSSVAVNLSGAP
jgi:hypothetical protein